MNIKWEEQFLLTTFKLEPEIFRQGCFFNFIYSFLKLCNELRRDSDIFFEGYMIWACLRKVESGDIKMTPLLLLLLKIKTAKWHIKWKCWLYKKLLLLMMTSTVKDLNLRFGIEKTFKTNQLSKYSYVHMKPPFVLFIKKIE